MLTLVTAPTELPLTLAELRAHSRLQGIDEGGETDALLIGYLASAVGSIDGRDGWLGRCLISQTWELALAEFPCTVITVPLPPLQSIETIEYIDSAGIEQTLDPGAYLVVGSDPARIVPAFGQSWPKTRHQLGAVKITFVAGYGLASDVPETIRHALQIMVGNSFDQCDSDTAKLMLMQFRAWG